MDTSRIIELKGSAISDLYAFIIAKGYSPTESNIKKLVGKFLQSTHHQYIPQAEDLTVDINADPGMLPTRITVSLAIPSVTEDAQNSWSKEQSDYIVNSILSSLKTITLEEMTDDQYASLMEQLRVNDTWPVMLPTSRLAPVKPLNLDFAIQELRYPANDKLDSVDSETLMRAAVRRYREDRVTLISLLNARGESPDTWGRKRIGRALQSNWIPIDNVVDYVVYINDEIRRLRGDADKKAADK